MYMKTCPCCEGQGIAAIACACGVLPTARQPLLACPVCQQYRWADCKACDRTGELTPLQFSRLAMGLADSEPPKAPPPVPGGPGA